MNPTPVPHSPVVEALVPSWMTVGEARAALVVAGARSLPVSDDDGTLIGLVTVEALSGQTDGVPSADDPVLSVMDWHLVQVDPDADEVGVLHAYADAATRWLADRRRAARRRTGTEAAGTRRPTPAPQPRTHHRPLWWMG